MAEESKKESLYDMALHATLVLKNTVGGQMEVTRVPGGWVYCFEYPGFRQSQIVFVPFDNGFMDEIINNKK
jgi:hypothetical protein